MARRLPAPVRVLLASLAAVAWGCVWLRPGVFFVDDAWFYLAIGEHLARGEGPTFTGDGPTNGFHPLWQAVVAGLAAVAGGATDRLLALVVAVQGLCVAGALWTLWKALADRPWPALAWVAVLVALLTDQGWGSEGMLALLLHGAVLWVWAEALAGREAARRGVGLLLGLLLLARLDTVFFAACLVLATALQDRRLALRLVVEGAITVAPWAIWTWLGTGQLVPVSGAIKSTFPVPDLRQPVAKLGWLGIGLVGLGAVNLVLGLARRDRLRLALGGGALLHGAYVACFTAVGWSTDVVYYYVTGVVGAGPALAGLLERLEASLPSLSAPRFDALVGALSVVAAAGATGRAVRALWLPPDPTAILAEQIRAELPDARLYAVDAPGRLAVLSGRPVHAMDGLTQSRAYSQALRQEGPRAWAARHGLTHLVSLRADYEVPWVHVRPRADGGVDVEVRAPDTGEAVGTLHLAGPPRLQVVDGPEGAVQVGVWPLGRR